MGAKRFSVRGYFLCLLALLGLTALSYLLSTVQTGAVETALALLVATVKGTLVALVFMHLWGGRFSNVVALVVSVLLVILLVALTAADVATREQMPIPPG
jgi:cytochrome c oxidase subunit 4